MKPATLIFLIDKKQNRICLGMKKRGFGVNRWNGYGGKVNEGETVINAAVRELQEEAETIVNKKDLTQIAFLNFTFVNKPEWGQEVTVYFPEVWSGDPVETEEMKPEWFSLDNVPYDSMWSSDIFWIPRALKGEKLEGEFTFKEGDEILSYNIKTLSI